MRSRAETGLALFLALGVFLGGCSSVPQTKTILLPEREARETGAEETEGQSYAVRKIYSREIEDGLSWVPEIYLDGEHSFRWWTERPAENSMESGKMVLAEISMDYRYGFYEERLLPLEAEALGSMPLLRETAEQKQYETETGCDPVSPDGKYAVYIDSAHTHTGDRLYLLDMDTGEKTLLLDGDVLNCSGEEYRILTRLAPLLPGAVPGQRVVLVKPMSSLDKYDRLYSSFFLYIPPPAGHTRLGQANGPSIASPFKPVPGELTLWRKARGEPPVRKTPTRGGAGRGAKRPAGQIARSASVHIPGSARPCLVPVQPLDILQYVPVRVGKVEPPLGPGDLVGAVQDPDPALLQGADDGVHVLRLKAEVGTEGPLRPDGNIVRAYGLDEVQPRAAVVQKGPLLPRFFRAAVKEELKAQLFRVKTDRCLQVPHAEGPVIVCHDSSLLSRFVRLRVYHGRKNSARGGFS